MQANALIVFGKGIIQSESLIPDDTRQGLGLCPTLLLDEQFQDPIAPTARGYLIHARLLPPGNGTEAEALQKGSLRDALSELLDRDARFLRGGHSPSQDQLVERNIAGGSQRDLCGFRHLLF
jgi:hypothetical protein